MTPPLDARSFTTDDVGSFKKKATTAFQTHQQSLIDFSRQLHANPEIGYQEFQATARLAEQLATVPGARVVQGLGSLPTAVKAESGNGDLTITICAEYDALPGVGHACGHNLIAASSLGAFFILSEIAADLDITVRLLGTPNEESDGGKAEMLRQGDFEGTHAALMVHPGNTDELAMNPLSCVDYTVSFQGQSAHASAEPWNGRNALDAMTIMLTAIGLARQQLKPDQQIHGMLHGAGSAPNVIPDSASGVWTIRAGSIESLREVGDVLRRCAEAGALATNTHVHLEQQGNVFADLKHDAAMTSYFLAACREFGRDLITQPGPPKGSTDMGNVSQFYPSIHPMLSVGPDAPPIHSPEFAQATLGPGAEQELKDASLAMAYTVIDLCTDPEQRARLLAHVPPPTGRSGLELQD